MLVGYTINWASVVLLLWVDSGGKLKWVVWGGLPGPPIRFPESHHLLLNLRLVLTDPIGQQTLGEVRHILAGAQLLQQR